MDLNNLWCCNKCAEYTTKEEAKNHICYANLKKEKKEIEEELSEIIEKIEDKPKKRGK